ncbi:hypothetical protein B9Z55_003881 [Caenorhabditis nigoni]|uniref:Uncharacterized protein n=1 Tax=Caenorhabditis nigoni TaxID=1611254 RepID=A0A2G5VSK5_9PELO|nr:hypothetical protein B9Z55_003881 [Caenorhabditis nigoni]
MGNAASGGSSGTSRSRGGGGGASSGNDYNNAMVFSNGRLAAAETSESFFLEMRDLVWLIALLNILKIVSGNFTKRFKIDKKFRDSFKRSYI